MKKEIQEISCSKLASYLSLFRKCFPNSARFSISYLDWIYFENPCGTVIGFDYFEGEILVAHYACIPVDFTDADGVTYRGLLSLNTATHPDYRGRGYFVRLADATFLLARRLGYDFVYGVANAQSTPGFLRSLGFTFVSSLDVKIGFTDLNFFGIPRVASVLSDERLQWRLSNPLRPILMIQRPNDHFHYFSSIKTYGSWHISAYASRPRQELTERAVPLSCSANSLRLYIGYDLVKSFDKYIDMPKFLRPSPLNLVFRDLGNRQLSFKPENISIDFLDFDVF